MLKTRSILWSIAFTLALSSCSSCKKEEPQPDPLPPESQSGRMIVACRINNKSWVVDQSKTFPNKPILVDYDSSTKDFSIIVFKLLENNQTENLTIRLKNFDKIGEYPTIATNNGYSSTGYYRDINKCTYELFSEGKVTITKFDKVNKIIAGRFEFYSPAKVIGNNCKSNDLKITNGFFDVQY